ncbi:helix-turn-helix transcriptional regulator [Brevibacillus sp. HB1.3]|uniref:helix-turn-helix domain-containing protein n=1 Tax=Brevibacillus sp. HB1.3 TaxID=2738842 RepID=UPI0015523D3A|nr:helix-turn-helix transcriptional regulator [Brevibacillus sp. HB1.3]
MISEGKTFGGILRVYRNRANLTLTELSERTGVASGTISKIESDAFTLPNMQHVMKLAKVLDIPLYTAIVPYLHKITREATLRSLLEAVMQEKNVVLTNKVALQLLNCPKSNTFLSLDYLYQSAGMEGNEELRLALYDVICDYSREHGIPLYLARSLFQRYMIRRENLSQLDQTYVEGKELLHYTSYLHINERILTYYKFSFHALRLGFYSDCIHLCKQGLEIDHSQSEQKAAAILAIIISYFELEDYTLGHFYLERYEMFDYPEVHKHARHIRGKLYGKTGKFDKAIPVLQECLAQQAQDEKIVIANDLLEIYIQVGDEEKIRELFLAEASILPENLTTPNQYNQMGLYFRTKGTFFIQKDEADLGIDSLVESVNYYRAINEIKQADKSLSVLFEFYVSKKKNLPFGILHKLVNVYNGSNHRSKQEV